MRAKQRLTKLRTNKLAMIVVVGFAVLVVGAGIFIWRQQQAVPIAQEEVVKSPPIEELLAPSIKKAKTTQDWAGYQANMLSLARGQENNGKPEAAIQTLEGAIAVVPVGKVEPIVYENLAVLYLTQKDSAKFEQYSQLAVELTRKTDPKRAEQLAKDFKDYQGKQQ
jgi:hypothetical protein